MVYEVPMVYELKRATVPNMCTSKLLCSVHALMQQ